MLESLEPRLLLAADSPSLAHGQVSVGSSWTSVTLPTSYESMVVVATPNYDSSSAPAVVRIQNATGNSFDVRVDEPGGNFAGSIDVNYIVVEEGVYDEPGFKLEASKFTSTITDGRSNWVGTSRSYQQAYTAPVVLGQVMTYNDPDWSVVWASGSSITSPPSSTDLTIGKHIGEDPDTTRADETIGYIVIESDTSGTATIEGLPYVAALGGDSILGIDGSSGYDYTYTSMANAQTAIATMAAMDGNNGGWAVLYGDDPITATGNTLRMAIDEDQVGDSERFHTSEQVAYLIISHVNRAPTISSTEVTAATQDAAYSYDVDAGDPDVGDTLTFSLDTAPSGMSINAGTGVISWTPSEAQRGANSVTVRVTDAEGLFDTQSFVINVASVDPKLAHGVVNVGSSWTTVNLPSNYASMVVVATPHSMGGSPGVVRVRNATGNSFQVRVDEPGGNFAGSVDVYYIVVEEGFYDQPGFKLEATKYTSTYTAGKNNWVGESRSYQQSYAAPVVLGQVMTYNDPDWSVFWASGSSPTSPPSSSALSVGKHIGEDVDTTRADETIGYIVFESETSGAANIEGLPYVAGVGVDMVRGVDNSFGYDYQYPSLGNASTAIVTNAAMDGIDGAWAVLYGDEPFTPGGNTLTLAVDEDRIGDGERNHTTEQIAYLIISQVNRAPTITSTAMTGATEDASYSYDVDASDLDVGDTQTFSLDAAPSGMSINSTSGVISWTPDNAQVGAHSVTVRVTDSAGLSDTQSFLVTVANVNDAPTISSTAVTSATQDAAYSYDVDASDPDVGDTQTFSLDAAPFGMSINAGTGVISWTPSEGQRGANNVTVRVTDGEGLFDTQSFVVDVASVDPKLAHGVVNVGSSWTTVNLPSDYASMVVVATPHSLGGSPGVVRVRNATGNSFEVRVDEPGGNFAGSVDVYYIVVEEGFYDQPGFKLEATKYTSTYTAGKNNWVGESRGYQQSYVAPVVLGQVMTYNDPDWSVFWASGSSPTSPPSSTALSVGKHIGEDVDKTRADETIGYIVVETETSGTASIGQWNYVAGVGADIVAGVANSPGYHYAHNLTNAGTAVVGNAGMDGIDGAWGVLYGPTPLLPSLSLAADEDQIGDGERTHTTEQMAYFVIASDNRAPTITSSAVTDGKRYSAYSYDVSASDPDAGDTLTYSLDSAPAGATIHSKTGLIQWMPSQTGSASVTVRVTDDEGLSDTQSFVISVSDLDYAGNGLPLLHSDPTAPAAIFVDFDCSCLAPNNLFWGPYDVDGDNTTFNTNEQNDIIDAWLDVAAHFAMFDVNVTTEHPDTVAVPTNWTVVSNDKSGGTSWGGWGTQRPRSANASGNARNRTTGIVHEIGHNFHLAHQSTFDTLGNQVRDYRNAADDPFGRGSIMGVDYAGDWAQWWRGYTNDKSLWQGPQDDIAKISSQIVSKVASFGIPYSGDGFRSDDHDGSLSDPGASATALARSGGSWSTVATIERMSDVDTFSFDWTGGNVNVSTEAQRSNNTGPVWASSVGTNIYVFDAAGDLAGFVEMSGQAAISGARTMNLPAGTYYVSVTSHGDYGDLGAYALMIAPASGSQPEFRSDWAEPQIVLTAGQTDVEISIASFSTASQAYTVERSSDGTSWSVVTSGNGNADLNFTDSGRNAGDTYFFRVRRDSDGRTSAAVQIDMRPAAVTAIVVHSLPWDTSHAGFSDTPSLLVTWNDTEGETGFSVERSSDGGSTWSVIGATGANENGFSQTGLPADTRFDYRVTPIDAQGVVDEATSLAAIGWATTRAVDAASLASNGSSNSSEHHHDHDHSHDHSHDHDHDHDHDHGIIEAIGHAESAVASATPAYGWIEGLPGLTETKSERFTVDRLAEEVPQLDTSGRKDWLTAVDLWFASRGSDSEPTDPISPDSDETSNESDVLADSFAESARSLA